MSIVSLVSGGLDSCLMAVVAKENGNTQFPLFIDYGQINMKKEWSSCKKVFKKQCLPKPSKVNISGYGKLIQSGLTNRNKHIKNDAFLPGRNLIFLIIGAAYAVQCNSDAVSIGLLNDDTNIFPDQTKIFLEKAENIINNSFNDKIKIIAPLKEFYKADVVELAREKGINETYSCHAGKSKPCGVCIACQEYITEKEV